MIKGINLQLFAEEDIDIEEEVIEEEIIEEEEAEVDEPEEPVEEKPTDKKTAAIIKAKQENKKLRDELAKYKQDELKRKEEQDKEKLKQKYIENGLDEEEAEERAAEKAERARLQNEIKLLKYERKAEKLEATYPDLPQHLDKFIKMVEASDGELTLEDLCKAKLERALDFDTRTKAEQESLIRRQKATTKKMVTPGDTPIQSVKLDSHDEKAYQNYLKFNPGISRKQYKEKILDVKFEEQW